MLDLSMNMQLRNQKYGIFKERGEIDNGKDAVSRNR